MQMTAAPKHERIAVGISGGVDSAVAALLLKRQGHEVFGVFMKNWEEDDTASHCSAAEDLEAAHAVCGRLSIPLRTVNFSTEYWDRVFAYFLDEYRAGRTPNPDVLCNKEIKFKAFLDHALDLGADAIATGHYARIERDGERFHLCKSRDHEKDQSYFLYMLDQAALSRVRFPVGELTKPEVRALAREAGLPNANRRDSTGICFIGERDFKSFLARYLPAQPGEIRSVDGEHKGRHDGLMYYTIGQRQGLGIGGPGEAWYVVDKDLARNVLVIAQGTDHPALFNEVLEATAIHWISDIPALPLDCTAKTRYRQPDQPCTVTPGESGTARVVFHRAQRAITPGQSVVFYLGERCLGGGIIVGARHHTAHAPATASID